MATRSRNFASLLRLFDPDFDADRQEEPTFDFSDRPGGRLFTQNPAQDPLYYPQDE